MAAFAFLASTLAFSAAARGQSLAGGSGTLMIQNGVVSAPGFTRKAVLAGPNGGSFPGPLITGNPNTHFQINVVNNLTDPSMEMSTTVHWHGLFQQGSDFMDGTAMITQCPIVPQESFLYDFYANGQAGTYWYHSHHHTQYCDGLRGPIVIYDPNDPQASLYDVDDATTVITLADWYTSLAKVQQQPSSSSATLINGLGRAFSGTTATALAVVSVTAGKRYRLRLVSISCDPNFMFSIDGHKMTIIEADGISHQPYVVDQIQIFAGQRYSVVLNANQAVGNYWIRANPNNPALSSPFAGGINSAILRYVGAPTTEPTTSSIVSSPMVESSLVPLVNPAAPGGASVNAPDVYALTVQMGFTGTGYTMNGVSFVPPSAPVLLQILNGSHTAQSLMPKGSVIELPANKTVQIAIPAGNAGAITAGAPHPFHLHGQSFSVVRGAGQSGYNFVNPPRRDVVNTGNQNDNVTIRFQTDNLGPWFLHCHIDWHLEAGLAIVFVVDQVSFNPPPAYITPPDWRDLCPAYNNVSAIDQ